MPDAPATDDAAMSDEDRMKQLRMKAMKAMDNLNKSNPSHGGQAFERRPDGVHLFNPDGTVMDKPASFNSKSGMYEMAPPKKSRYGAGGQ